MAGSLVLGVDIGGTKIAAAVASPAGEIVAHRSTPTDLSGDTATLQSILDAIQGALDVAGIASRDLTAIGIGAPGDVDIDTGYWWGSTNVRLAAPPVPLVALIEERFGRPTCIENDVRAGTLGEHRYGAGRGLQHMVYLSAGTGIAAGLIANGRLYRSLGETGEIGHVSIAWDGPLCGCGTRGCLEMLASGAALARRGRAAALRDSDTLIARLAGGDPDAVTGQIVMQAAAAGDLAALRAVSETADYLAMGVVMALRAYDPQLVVLAGGLMQAGEILMAPLRQALAHLTGPRYEACLARLATTALGDKAGVLGAVALAAQNCPASSPQT